MCSPTHILRSAIVLGTYLGRLYKRVTKWVHVIATKLPTYYVLCGGTASDERLYMTRCRDTISGMLRAA